MYDGYDDQLRALDMQIDWLDVDLLDDVLAEQADDRQTLAALAA